MLKGLGERLGLKREQTGLTCAEVAKELGLSKTTISEYENDKTRPSIETIVKLAGMYDCTTDYLLGVRRSSTNLTADLSGLTPRERDNIRDTISCYEEAHSKHK